MMVVRKEFAQQVRDALDHLYDGAHLEGHVLGEALFAGPPAGGVSRAQALRRALLEAIDRLQPAPHVPYGDRAWRPYRALFLRYVQRLPLARILEELALSDRQYQRERARALRCLTVHLWEQASAPVAPGSAGDGVSEEVRRLVAGARRERLDAEVLIRGAVLAVQRLAESRQVSVEPAFAPDLPPIYGDGGLLRQIILNVLSFLLARGEGGSIRLAVDGADGEARFLFARQGADMPAPSGSPRLDLSRQLAEAIGGRLWVAGGTIHLQLPLHEKTVLVVDDNQDLIRLFERFLADSRYRVLGAQTAEQALALARDSRPFLITLDVMMPAHDGWELLQNLKHSPETGHIPVAVCTILNEAELAFSLGADDYVKKPVTQQDLLALMARWDQPAPYSLPA